MKSSLSDIIERWAERYRPIAHQPAAGSKDKAFYRIRSISDNSEFVRNQHTAKSPCVAYSVLIDAEASGTDAVNYEHTIYFLMKNRSSSLAKSARQDDDAVEDVQQQLDEFAQDLLAYLHRMKLSGSCPVTKTPLSDDERRMLRGMDFSKAHWSSLPVKFSEWHILGLQIEQVSPRTSCIDAEKYQMESEYTPDPF